MPLKDTLLQPLTIDDNDEVEVVEKLSLSSSTSTAVTDVSVSATMHNEVEDLSTSETIDISPVMESKI
jgi:hypothetical protein